MTKNNDCCCCWFEEITPATAQKEPKYAPFVGMYLVTECTDHLDQGAIVTDLMIIAEQAHHARLSSQPCEHVTPSLLAIASQYLQ